MSRYTKIICSICGKDLYDSLGIKEIREKQSKHVEYYQVSDNGKEDEVCPQCYEYFFKEKCNEGQD